MMKVQEVILKAIPGSLQSFVFLPSHLDHSISQVLGHMELIEDDLVIRFRHVLPYRCDVRIHMSMA